VALRHAPVVLAGLVHRRAGVRHAGVIGAAADAVGIVAGVALAGGHHPAGDAHRLIGNRARIRQARILGTATHAVRVISTRSIAHVARRADIARIARAGGHTARHGAYAMA